MADRLDDLLAALDRERVPVSWADVEARVTGGGRSMPSRGRGWVLSAAASAVLVALVTIAVVVLQEDDDREPTDVGPASTSTTTTTEVTTTTVGPDESAITRRTFPVTVWSGRRYLVWGGEEGSDATLADDGWMFDPATGDIDPIPAAPISPRSGAAGAWTGETLLVCCGIAADTDAAQAAEFDPRTGQWRRLADPPDELAGRYATALAIDCPYRAFCFPDGLVVDVVAGTEAGSSAVVRWERGREPWDQLGEELVDLGVSTDLAAADSGTVVWDRSPQGGGTDVGWYLGFNESSWRPLPPLPDGNEVTWGSMTSNGFDVFVWGLSTTDDTRSVGARWRPGDPEWRPLPDPGLPPIDPYEGTPGSQQLVWDPATERLIVYPTHGYEYGLEEGTGNPGPVPILAYDPATDTWERLGEAFLGYAPQLTAGGGYLLRPDPADPIVLDLTP